MEFLENILTSSRYVDNMKFFWQNYYEKVSCTKKKPNPIKYDLSFDLDW